MGWFRSDRRTGQTRLLSLEVSGFGSERDQRAFTASLRALSRQHGVTIHGLDRLPSPHQPRQRPARRPTR